MIALELLYFQLIVPADDEELLPLAFLSQTPSALRHVCSDGVSILRITSAARECPCPESRRMPTSAARMAKRRRHPSERRTGCPERASGDGAWALPSPVADQTQWAEADGAPKRSWIGCTASGARRIPSMARTQASAAGSVVMQGTP